MFDYPTLRVIWWVLCGALIAGFIVIDGLDLGIAALLPLVTKSNEDRRLALKAVTPVWSGNQIAFIVCGVFFLMAWPFVVKMALPMFYFLIPLILFTFIIRRLEKPTLMRSSVLSILGLLTAFLFGVVIGSVLQGLPFYFNTSLHGFYSGSFSSLFNAFTLFCGLLCVSMLLMLAGFYISMRSDDAIRERAILLARISAVITVVLFSIAGVWLAQKVDGYVVLQILGHAQGFNPNMSDIAKQVGSWITNYYLDPGFIVVPLLGFLGAVAAIFTARYGERKLAFLLSSFSVLGIVASVGVSMFPFILPSSTHPGNSLLVWNASANEFVLSIMLISTFTLLPAILLTATWFYRRNKHASPGH